MYAYLWFECFSLSIKMYDTRLNINVQGKAVMQCFYFLSSRGKKIMIYDIICHVHKCMQLCLFLNYVHVPLKIIHVRQCGNTCNIKEDKKGVWRILLEREREIKMLLVGYISLLILQIHHLEFQQWKTSFILFNWKGKF